MTSGGSNLRREFRRKCRGRRRTTVQRLTYTSPDWRIAVPTRTHNVKRPKPPSKWVHMQTTSWAFLQQTKIKEKLKRFHSKPQSWFSFAVLFLFPTLFFPSQLSLLPNAPLWISHRLSSPPRFLSSPLTSAGKKISFPFFAHLLALYNLSCLIPWIFFPFGLIS